MCLSVCLSVCLSLAAFRHYCTDPDVAWGNGRGFRLVVQYWADLQSVHGFCYYDNIAPNAKCQRVLVLALCLVVTVQLEEEETAGTVRLSKFLPLMTQVLLERRSVSITVFINHLYSGPGGAIS